MRLLAAALLAFGCALAYGHGLGSELLPAQEAGGRSVSVEITGSQAEYGSDFAFRALDAESGEAVGDVEYRIRAQKAGEVLFEGEYGSASGTLVFELEDGERREESGGGLLGLFGDRRVRVSGPHFGSGGLYSFDVELLRAGAPLEPPPYWRGGVSLTDVQEISVRTGFGEQAILHMSYYDTVKDLRYSGGRIAFEMPFDGTPETISQVATVHEEVRISKEFGDLMVSEISAVVNGSPAPPEAVQIDDFAEGYRTIHVVLGRDVLEGMYEDGTLGSELSFSLGPAAEGLPLTTVTRNGQYRIVAEISPRQAEPGGALEISYQIQDVFLKDRPVSAEHTVYAESGGGRFFQERMAGSSSYGPLRAEVPPGAGLIHVGFEGIGGASLAEARLPVPPRQQVPEWVRGTVQLWVQGDVSDPEFTAAAGYLVSIGVIDAQAPQEPGPGGQVPGWARETARLWTERAVPDSEFVAGIERLMELGAVR